MWLRPKGGSWSYPEFDLKRFAQFAVARHTFFRGEFAWFANAAAALPIVFASKPSIS